MRFSEADYVFSPAVFASEVARLLPEYLPGTETGPATITDRRSCWIRSMRALFEALGRHHGMRVCVEEPGATALGRQLHVFWKRGDAVSLALYSGWGDREELEKAFQALELLKVPHKVILYSCARWQEAVLDQLSGALLRYPHHIEGEQYISLNVVGAERRLTAHCRPILISGSLKTSDIDFRELSGSPYRWGSAGLSSAAQE
jgi:hypothetical protein